MQNERIYLAVINNYVKSASVAYLPGRDVTSPFGEVKSRETMAKLNRGVRLQPFSDSHRLMCQRLNQTHANERS